MFPYKILNKWKKAQDNYRTGLAELFAAILAQLSDYSKITSGVRKLLLMSGETAKIKE